jgi:hypothetical protein
MTAACFRLNSESASLDDARSERIAVALAQAATPHRNQGGLRRWRLRRLHRGGGRARRQRRDALVGDECLPAADGRDRRARSADGGGAGAWCDPAPGATGDDRHGGVAVRLLHARLRDEPVRGAGQWRRRARCDRGQPVPLHRISPDPAGGGTHCGVRGRARSRRGTAPGGLVERPTGRLPQPDFARRRTAVQARLAAGGVDRGRHRPGRGTEPWAGTRSRLHCPGSHRRAAGTRHFRERGDGSAQGCR